MADGDKSFPLISINTHSILNLVAGGVKTGGEGRSFGNIANMLPAIWWSISNLELAQLVLPKKPWRIISSVKRSTVWDGDDTLFDFNFQAMGIPPDECFQDANKKMKKPGQHIVCHFAQHYTKEP